MNANFDNRFFPSVLFLIAILASLGYCIVVLSDATETVWPVFASSRLAMTHILASVPIVLLLADRFRNRWPLHHYGFLLVGGFTLLLPYALESVSWTLKQSEVGFLLRSFLRCGVSIGILFAWIATSPIPIAWSPKRAWSWMLLLCFAFPTIYAWKQAENCREEFDACLSGMRVSRSYYALERLVEIAGAEKYKGIAIEDWQRKLKQEIVQTERKLAIATPGVPDLNDYLQRAMLLLSISRDAEAVQMLLDSRSTDPQVVLLLAISAREQKDFSKVELWCRELLADTQTTNGDSNSLAFQLLGESLVAQRKIRSAIASYELAIQRSESEQVRGEFEMRLGTLRGEAGDSLSAVAHFERAARFVPEFSQEAKKRIRGLRSNSCELWNPASATKHPSGLRK